MLGLANAQYSRVRLQCLSSSSRCTTSSATAGCRRVPLRCQATAASTTETYQLNFNNCLDKKHEGKALKDIIQLPPAALQGLSNKADDMLAALQIKTIEDLGKWKFFSAARAIAALATTEEPGGRPAGAASNINGILDRAWEARPLNDILAAPPSALQGLGPVSDEVLASLGIRSVGDLAVWKFAVWADALTTLAQHERADGSS